MNGYFYTLLVASICGAMCAMLAWGGFEKYIKYIASLICVCLMIMPLREVDVSEALNLEAENSDVFLEVSCEGLYDLAAEMTEERAETYISDIVFSQFGIKTVYADIKIDWKSEEPIVENISVALAKEDMGAESKVREYLSKELGGEVNIIET